MRRTRIAALLAGAGMLVTATACATEEKGGGGGSAEEVVIGAIGLRVGPAPIVGRDLGTAITDWFDMINDGGGINGRKVRFVEIEAQYDTAKGVEAYNRLKQEKIVGFFPLGLGNALSLGPMAKNDQIVMLAPGTGQGENLSGSTAPYEFSGGASYPAQHAAMVQHATDDWKTKGNTGLPRIGSLCWDNPPGRTSCQAIRKASEKIGATVVIETFIAPTTADLGPQALRFRDAKPDYVFLSGGGKTPQLALTAFRGLGINAPIYNNIWGFNNDVWDPAGAAADGYTGTSMASYHKKDAKAYTMLKAYWTKAGKTPPAFLEEPFYAQGLVMANLMTEGIRQADRLSAGKAITGPTLKQGFETISQFDANGLTCPVTITPEDHIGTRAVNLYSIKQKTPQIVGECVQGPRLD
jgi:branched-chain amino acid transport system substrate-binding protein